MPSTPYLVITTSIQRTSQQASTKELVPGIVQIGGVDDDGYCSIAILCTSNTLACPSHLQQHRIKGYVSSSPSALAASTLISSSSLPTATSIVASDPWWAEGVERVEDDGSSSMHPTVGKLRLKGMSLKQLEGMVESLGHKKEKAKQLFRWMYHKVSRMDGWMVEVLEKGRCCLLC